VVGAAADPAASVSGTPAAATAVAADHLLAGDHVTVGEHRVEVPADRRRAEPESRAELCRGGRPPLQQ
jgi:hypothetical protein